MASTRNENRKPEVVLKVRSIRPQARRRSTSCSPALESPREDGDPPAPTPAPIITVVEEPTKFGSQKDRRLHPVSQSDPGFFVSKRSPRHHMTSLAFTFTIMSAKDLLAVDLGGRSDPYVKVSLFQVGELPRDILKTPVIKNDLNPNWAVLCGDDKTPITTSLTFSEGDRLRFQVFDWNKVAQHEPLGHVEISYIDACKLLGSTGSSANVLTDHLITEKLTGKKAKGHLNIMFSLKHGIAEAQATQTSIAPKSKRKLAKPSSNTILSLAKDFSNTSKKMDCDLEGEENEFVTNLLHVFSRYYDPSDDTATRIQGDIRAELLKFETKLGIAGRGIQKETDRLGPKIDPTLVNLDPEWDALINLARGIDKSVGEKILAVLVGEDKPEATDFIYKSFSQIGAALNFISEDLLVGAELPEKAISRLKGPISTLHQSKTKSTFEGHTIPQSFIHHKMIDAMIRALSITISQQSTELQYQIGVTVMAKLSPVVTDGGLLTLGLISTTCALCNTLITNIATLTHLATLSKAHQEPTPRTENPKSEDQYKDELIKSSINPEPNSPLIVSTNPFRPGTYANVVLRIMTEPGQEKLIEAVLTSCKIIKNSLEEFWGLIKAAWDLKPSLFKSKIEQHEVHARLSYFILQIVQFDPNLLTAGIAQEIRSFAKQKATTLLGASSKILQHLTWASGTKDTSFLMLNFSATTTWESPAHVGLFLFHFHSYEIAEQLTLIDWQIYSRIDIKELQQLKWDKPLEEALCNNVSTLIKRLNSMANWVCTLILSTKSEQDRAAIVMRFVAIARVLLQIKNFGSFMGIMTGLNSVPVSRLRRTNALFQKNFPVAASEFEQLSNLQDPTGSFANLRNASKTAGSQVLPFIGTTLGDLLLIDEGNTNTLTIDKAVVLNVPKFRLIAEAINGFLQFQRVAQFGTIKQQEPLYSYLRALPHVEGPDLYEMSVYIEPRVSAKPGSGGKKDKKKES